MSSAFAIYLLLGAVLVAGPYAGHTSTTRALVVPYIAVGAVFVAWLLSQFAATFRGGR